MGIGGNFCPHKTLLKEKKMDDLEFRFSVIAERMEIMRAQIKHMDGRMAAIESKAKRKPEPSAFSEAFAAHPERLKGRMTGRDICKAYGIEHKMTGVDRDTHRLARAVEAAPNFIGRRKSMGVKYYLFA